MTPRCRPFMASSLRARLRPGVTGGVLGTSLPGRRRERAGREADEGAGMDEAVRGQAVGTDLSGRAAVVTGAASGIGEACARRLARAGAEGVAGELGAKAVVADLSDRDAVLRLDLTADILVNNAGLQHVAPVEAFPPERFAVVLAVMVEAPFLLIRSALPRMYERGWGRVVNISSVHGLRASPYKSAYVAAKHGLEGLSKVVALEGGPHGVTSNCICPAYVRTPMVEGQIAEQARIHGIPADQVVADVMLKEPAVKRLIEPAEVAEVAAFLCSPAGSFINGASLTLDGGWTAR